MASLLIPLIVDGVSKKLGGITTSTWAVVADGTSVLALIFPTQDFVKNDKAGLRHGDAVVAS